MTAFTFYEVAGVVNLFFWALKQDHGEVHQPSICALDDGSLAVGTSWAYERTGAPTHALQCGRGAILRNEERLEASLGPTKRTSIRMDVGRSSWIDGDHVGLAAVFF